MDALCRQMNTKLATAQEHYKPKLDRTVSHTPKFDFGRHVFVERPPVQMTESARVENPLLPKLLPKTLGPFIEISATSNTVKMDGDGNHNTVARDGVMFAPTLHKLMMKPIEIMISGKQEIAGMKRSPTETTHA